MRSMTYEYDESSGRCHIHMKVDRPGRIPDFINNYGEYWFKEMVRTRRQSSGHDETIIMEPCPVTGLLMYFDGSYSQCWNFDKQRDLQEAYEMWVDKSFEDNFLLDEEGM